MHKPVAVHVTTPRSKWLTGAAAATLLPGAVFVLAAMHGGTPNREMVPVHTPTPKALAFRPVIAPFPVSDSTGRLLEMAFLGGFERPRPQLVDADGDGDLDLFVQEVRKIGYYERDGERDGLPHFVFKTDKYGDIDAGQWYRFADVDGDGDLDLLTEQPFSYIKYYRNDGAKGGALHFSLGADTLRAPNGKPIFADPQNIPYLGDLDCNGRADLLIGVANAGTIIRYEATAATASGAAGAPVFELVANEFEGIRLITGEGALGSPLGPPASGQPAAGPRGPSAPESAGGRKHGANTMALSDIDNDGDLDLFWGDYFEPGLLLIRNTGSCQTPNFRSAPVRFPEAAPLMTSAYNAPAFGDVNGDKRADLVVGVLGGAYNPLLTLVRNLIYMERGASDAWTIRTRQLLPVLDVGNESIPALVDLDGDGDLDLLLANKIDPNNTNTSRIYRLENVGSKTKPEFLLRDYLQLRSPRAVSDSFHFAPAFGDLDGDGRLDMVLGKFKAALARYEQGADGFDLVDSVLVEIPRGQNTAPALGDLDGDGDLDLLIGEASGWLNFYRNEGSRTKPRFVLVSENFEDLKVGSRSAPHLVDIDNDGDLDLFVGYAAEGLVLYRNLGSRTKPRFEQDSLFAPPVPAMAAPTTGDLDGDGDLDLIVGGAGGGAVYLEQQ